MRSFFGAESEFAENLTQFYISRRWYLEVFDTLGETGTIMFCMFGLAVVWIVLAKKEGIKFARHTIMPGFQGLAASSIVSYLCLFRLFLNSDNNSFKSLTAYVSILQILLIMKSKMLDHPELSSGIGSLRLQATSFAIYVTSSLLFHKNTSACIACAFSVSPHAASAIVFLCLLIIYAVYILTLHILLNIRSCILHTAMYVQRISPCAGLYILNMFSWSRDIFRWIHSVLVSISGLFRNLVRDGFNVTSPASSPET